MKKRLAALFITFLMVCSFVPAVALAAEPVVVNTYEELDEAIANDAVTDIEIGADIVTGGTGISEVKGKKIFIPQGKSLVLGGDTQINGEELCIVAEGFFAVGEKDAEAMPALDLREGSSVQVSGGGYFVVGGAASVKLERGASVSIDGYSDIFGQFIVGGEEEAGSLMLLENADLYSNSAESLIIDRGGDLQIYGKLSGSMTIDGNIAVYEGALIDNMPDHIIVTGANVTRDVPPGAPKKAIDIFFAADRSTPLASIANKTFIGVEQNVFVEQNTAVVFTQEDLLAVSELDYVTDITIGADIALDQPECFTLAGKTLYVPEDSAFTIANDTVFKLSNAKMNVSGNVNVERAEGADSAWLWLRDGSTLNLREGGFMNVEGGLDMAQDSNAFIDGALDSFGGYIAVGAETDEPASMTVGSSGSLSVSEDPASFIVNDLGELNILGEYSGSMTLNGRLCAVEGAQLDGWGACRVVTGKNAKYEGENEQYEMIDLFYYADGKTPAADIADKTFYYSETNKWLYMFSADVSNLAELKTALDKDNVREINIVADIDASYQVLEQEGKLLNIAEGVTLSMSDASWNVKYSNGGCKVFGTLSIGYNAGMTFAGNNDWIDIMEGGLLDVRGYLNLFGVNMTAWGEVINSGNIELLDLETPVEGEEPKINYAGMSIIGGGQNTADGMIAADKGCGIEISSDFIQDGGIFTDGNFVVSDPEGMLKGDGMIQTGPDATSDAPFNPFQEVKIFDIFYAKDGVTKLTDIAGKSFICAGDNFWWEYDRLAAPKLSFTNVNCNSNMLSWTKVEGATQYALYRKEHSATDREWEALTTVNELKYVDNDVTPGVYYDYFVCAQELIDGIMRDGRASNVAIVCARPAKVPSTTVKQTSAGALVSWGKVSDVTRYYIRRYEAGSGKDWVGVAAPLAKTQSWTDKNVKKGKTYYYYVWAYKTVNGKNIFGYAGPRVTVKIK